MRLVTVLALAGCGRVAFDRTAARDGATPLPDVNVVDAVDAALVTVPLINGGTFYRSYDLGSDAMFPDMSYPATVSDFRLDLHEVTVARFRAFVDAGAGTQASAPTAGAGAHAAIAASGWDPTWNAQLPVDSAALRAQIACGAPFTMWTDAPSGMENRPMNCLTWYEAFAFCIWDGGYLPTETEWDYAAAGGNEQRAYPWSAPASDVTVDPTHASYYVDATIQCGGDGVDGCTEADLVPVGSLPAGNGRWGQSDLGGNLWEWTLDYADTYQLPCNDCANLTPQTQRTIRGGAFHVAALNLRAALRQALDPAMVPFDTGVRCARAP